MVLAIAGKRYPMKFGYGCLRMICEQYGYNKLSGFDTLIKDLKLDKINDPTFEQLDFVSFMIKAAILNAQKSAEVDQDDIMDVLICDTGVIAKVFTEFQKSLPNADKANPSKRGK